MLTEYELKKVCEAIAGRLLCMGVTIFNFNDENCEKALQDCVLANKIIPIFFDNNETIYKIIEKELTVS